MTKYNKAYAGGIGAAVAFVLGWAAETFFQVSVPVEMQGALAIILSGLGPMVGPANKE